MRGQLPIGAVLGGYRIIELIGEGAGGAVYLAEHEDGTEPVALKVLADGLTHDDRFRRRFLRESTIAAGLRNPHVVGILDFGEEDGRAYLAMRHIDGLDMRELLARDGPLEPEEALRLVAEVGEALDEAHAHGLVHRDVKPANILVARDGTAYLGDFGLAKHASSPSSLTGDQSFVGTIAYVAPEQIKGEQVDGRADVYALTCVLYEALTGRTPFERESELAVLFAHLHEQAPRASDVRPELPAGLDHVLRTGTATEPKDRYASCAELVAAARGAIAGEPGPRASGRRRTAALAGVVLAAAVAALIVVISSGGPRGAAPVHRLAVAGDGLALVNARTHSVAARIALPGLPSDVVFDRRSAWALLGEQQQVAQIDLRRRRVVRTVKLPFAAGGIAGGDGAVFVTERGGGPGVARIASRTAKVVAHWAIATRGARSSDPSGIAVGAGSVWLARGAQVVRIDAKTGRVQHRFALPVTATLLQFAGGELWAASSENGTVEKIDPAAERIAAVAKLHGWLSAMTVGGGSVWVTEVPNDVVVRLNIDDASVEGQARGAGGAESLAAAPGAIFVAGSSARTLARLDIATGRRTTIPLAGSPQVVREHAGLLWVAAVREPALPAAASGPQVRVATAEDVNLDPAPGNDPTGAQLEYATCLKLFNYPDAAGAAGQRLRPEAAAAAPTRSADGRTWTFRIRSGLRFSPPSGAPVTAAALKWTIERTISPALGTHSSGMAALSKVAGAEAYGQGRAKDVTGIVARGSELSITTTAPLGDLPARLALPIFCAVPAGTPAPGHTTGPIPSAGPYYVRAQLADRLVLDRNPNYRGPRPRRPARITYLTGVPSGKAVALADGGQADVVPWDYDPNSAVAPGGPLARRARDGRYHTLAAPGVDMLAFNTHRPLFRSARLRRAVNYAIDRPALAAIYGEGVTDGYVPPAVPGASRSAVYPLSGPDLVRARALAGPARARTARLYFCGDPINLRIAQALHDELRPIGIHIVVVQSFGCLSGPDPLTKTADLSLITRATQLLDPEPFLEAAVGDQSSFGSGGEAATWTDPVYRRRLAAATLLPEAPRLAALRRIEDDMLRTAAPYAAYGSFTSGEYVSARSSCRVIQGAYGVIDLAALCVRSS